MSYNNSLARAIAIADYILEDDGHSTKEAATEFRISKDTVLRSLTILGSYAYYNYNVNEPELMKKYLKVKKTLAIVAKRIMSSKKD